MTLEVKIRPALLEDLNAIATLSKSLLKYDREFDATIDLDWIEKGEGMTFLRERILDPNALVLVAEIQGKIAGYLVGGFVNSETYRTALKLFELEEILVSDDFRGQNIGSKLIEEFFAYARNSKADRAIVVVSAKNKRSIELYRRLGFIDYDLVLEKEL